MGQVFLVLPIVIPLGTAALATLVWRQRRAQRTIGVLGAVGLLAAALALLWTVWNQGDPQIQTVQAGGWAAPFGITLVADLLAAIMVTLAGIMGLCVAVYSLVGMDPRREAFGYYPLLHVLLMGVCGAFVTGDLFNLYVWFEVMLMASFVLLALGGEQAQLEGAIKYVTINLIASAVLLAAVGLIYGITGRLNMAELAILLPSFEPAGLVRAVAMLYLVAFGLKAAIFPLFFWLPASYHTPPAAISAIFAGLLTKVGVYAMARVFTLLFVGEDGQAQWAHQLILVLAGVTMLTGVLGAVAQHDFRRILSWNIVSGIGYMILGIGLFTRLALTGTVFCLVHHVIVKTNLFLVSGVANRLRGSYELKRLGGLYHDHPGLAILFLLPAMSLAGVPPLSGFFAKLILVKASLEIEQFAAAAVALLVGLLTLYSMTTIWAEAFWKPLSEDTPPRAPLTAGSKAVLLAPIVVLTALTVAIGLAGQPLFELSQQAADQLLDRQGYIDAVLPGYSVNR